MHARWMLCVAVCLPLASARAQSFVNWESPHVHPLDMTPDGTKLLAVNTADNRLEVFNVSPPGNLSLSASIPVGLDPVSVRARTNTEAWVVNHVSDSVSIVDLNTSHVVATLRTADEPADVVFAGTNGDAFVSCSQVNKVMVFSIATLGTVAPIEIDINGEEPKALAVSPDGSQVYVAIFESGNASTILNGGHGLELNRFVGNPNLSTPYGGQNPPPNGPGGTFVPPQNPSNPPPPGVGLIVKKNDQGQWLDDNGEDWTQWVSGPDAGESNRPVGWDLPDRDIAIIDADTKTVSNYAHRFMNIVMGIATNPATGDVSVIGTDGINEVRYEANLNGIFLRVNIGIFDPANPPVGKIVKDLNPHLDYTTSNVAMSERQKSVGDSRAIVWTSDGSTAFISGLGSNNIIRVNASGDRIPDPVSSLTEDAVINVGQGPTGLVLDEGRGLLFVLNRFDATITIVTLNNMRPRATFSFYDPTPDAITIGRKHLYDTIATSGLGHVSCGSCHVDARMDRLAWDLGQPEVAVELTALDDQNLGAGMPDLEPGTAALPFEPWHPMKGPMTTQTLRDIIGQEPHHWRGDRFGLEEFSPAFVGLLGDDAEPSASDMQEFEDFIATVKFPPNPFRNLDNTLPTNLPLPGHFATGRFDPPGLPAGAPLPNGDAVNGLFLYREDNLAIGGTTDCVFCHTLPTGMGPDMTWNGTEFTPFPVGPMGEHHRALITADGQSNRVIKTPQLRNMHEKTGFNFTQLENNAGFGYLHDGSFDSIEHFVGFLGFGVSSDQEIADLTAFMLAFSGSDLPEGDPFDVNEPPGGPSGDTHAAVGRQTTLVDEATATEEQLALIDAMTALADLSVVGLVVKGRQNGVARGYAYVGGMQFQSDRTLELLSAAVLRSLAATGSELTYTVVPAGSETRIGIDRDEDGHLDQDELDACSDPADPTSIPGAPGADIDGNGTVNVDDIAAFVAVLLGTPMQSNHVDRSDMNCDGLADGGDGQGFNDSYLLQAGG